MLGEISSGDFRADQMEGKLTHQRTLSSQETERIYQMIIHQRDEDKLFVNQIKIGIILIDFVLLEDLLFLRTLHQLESSVFQERKRKHINWKKYFCDKKSILF